MDREELALSFHERGFNCAQSVLACCGDLTGLPEETALAVAGGFGGGLRCGEVCGALSGAVMALGIAYPFSRSDDPAAKERIANVARDACERFREAYGCVRCRELLDAVGDKSRCGAFIAFGAQLVEELTEEKDRG